MVIGRRIKYCYYFPGIQSNQRVELLQPQLRQHYVFGETKERQKEGQEKDPICGMGVDKKNAEHLTEYKGEKYYFCCSGCLEKFESEPAVYV